MKIPKRIVKSTLSLMLVGIGLFAGQAWAAPIVVNNFSFELPSLGGAGFVGCPISDWTCTPNTSSLGVYVPVSPTQYASDGTDGLTSPNRIVPDGNQAGYVQTTGGFTQNTTALIADNTTYTLSVFVGHRHDSGYPSAVTINLTENGIFIASTPVGDPGAGVWTNPTLTYTTTTGAGDPFQGATLGIALFMNGTGGEVDFDNVTLNAAGPDNAVPEPTTILLLGTGLVALGLIRRRTAV
jgi:hypothetical protein